MVRAGSSRDCKRDASAEERKATGSCHGCGYVAALGRKKASTTRTGNGRQWLYYTDEDHAEFEAAQNTDWEYMSTSGFSVDNIQLCARRTGGFPSLIDPNMAARRRSSVGRCAKEQWRQRQVERGHVREVVQNCDERRQRREHMLVEHI